MRPGTSGRPSFVVRGQRRVARLAQAAHVADQRDRADRVVVALEAPGRDRGVVDRAVEGEVQLDVPLEPVDGRARCRRSAGSAPARRRRGWRGRSSGPGGVSDFGPSAQNSAMTRPKSASLTTSGGYGWPVTGLTGWPCPSFVPSELPPRAPGEMSIVAGLAGSSRLLSRMISTTWSLKAWSVAGSPSRGWGPGSIGTPLGSAGRQRERSSRGPSRARPPAGRRSSPGSRSGRSCARSGAAASGSGRPSSCRGLATTSGGFTGL